MMPVVLLTAFRYENMKKSLRPAKIRKNGKFIDTGLFWHYNILVSV